MFVGATVQEKEARRPVTSAPQLEREHHDRLDETSTGVYPMWTALVVFLALEIARGRVRGAVKKG